MLLDIATLLRQDKKRLEAALGLDSGTSRLEVQMLLQSALNAPRSYLLAHSEQVLNATQQAAYAAMLQRRLQGEPITHILGEREFFGLNFKVTPDTLIPRPETELLVELALQRISQTPPSLPNPPMPLLSGGGKSGEELGRRRAAYRVLDLGTGSGAIALSIAHARPDAEVTAVDASEAALGVARENAQRLGITNVGFEQSDWFSALAGQRFDLIVSNPPYIAAGDKHLAEGDVRFEPISALASGTDGLDDIRRIVRQAGNFLEPGAWLLLEHGYDQATQVCELLRQNEFAEVFSAKDIAGIDRVSGGVISR